VDTLDLGKRPFSLGSHFIVDFVAAPSFWDGFSLESLDQPFFDQPMKRSIDGTNRPFVSSGNIH
jgi:hypothetical protein